MNEAENWYHGSFNFCIPVTINNWKPSEQPGSRVLLRFPLSYRVDDVVRPGNGDEKIRCEAGAMLGFKKTAPMFQSRSYMALVHLMVKRYSSFSAYSTSNQATVNKRANSNERISSLGCKTSHFSPVAFSIFVADFYHGLDALSLLNMCVTRLQTTCLVIEY